MMHLYHVLSKERLQQKLAHAEAHDGELLLTGHAPVADSAEGALEAYIHLLPNLVGGITFSARHEVAALRVTVDPDRREAGVLHVLWSESGLWFQEWLLCDPTAVTAWTVDEAVLRADFLAQLAALREGQLGPSTWFYPDMAHDAQVGMAELIGARLGYLAVDDPAARKLAFERACYRLGVQRHDATKCRSSWGRRSCDSLARWRAGRGVPSCRSPWSRRARRGTASTRRSPRPPGSSPA